MKGYLEAGMHEDVRTYLHKAQHLVSCLDRRFDHDHSVLCPRRSVRCHELARAVGDVLGLPWRDGYFRPAGRRVDHSWLLVKSPGRMERPYVLDVYVPGAVPQVCVFDPRLWGDDIYEVGEERYDIQWDIVRKLLARFRQELNIHGSET